MGNAKERTVFFTVKMESSKHYAACTEFVCNATSMLDALKKCQAYLKSNALLDKNAVRAIEVYEAMPSKAVAAAMAKFDPDDDGEHSVFGTKLEDACAELQEHGKKAYAIVGSMKLDDLIRFNRSQETEAILNFDAWDLAVGNGCM